MGALVGYRKLVVGNRDWRLVWRVTSDDAGGVTVEIAEVWAAGARRDEDVYREMRDRVAALPDSPTTVALAQVVALLAPEVGLAAAVEPRSDPVPDWLRDRLVHSAGLRSDEVDQLAGAEAADRWDRFIRGDG